MESWPDGHMDSGSPLLLFPVPFRGPHLPWPICPQPKSSPAAITRTPHLNYGNHEQFIEIDRPVRTVYNQWTQFEDFPAFMEGVKSVRQLDDKRLEWVADIAGKEKSWQAEIFEQDPANALPGGAWKAR